jgi:hypothetical protein
MSVLKQAWRFLEDTPETKKQAHPTYSNAEVRAWVSEMEQSLKDIEGHTLKRDEITKESLLDLSAWEASVAGLKPLMIRLDQITVDPQTVSPIAFRALHPDYESPKMQTVTDACIEHLETHPETGGVIFCEYVAGLKLAQEALIKRGVPADQIELYYGAVSPKKRREIERKLNEGEIKIVLGQTKALETGANLQKRANFVAHLNTPWAPDTLTQSTARVFRQGQRRKTTVLRPTGSLIDRIKDKTVTRKIAQTGMVTGAQMQSDEAVIRTTADVRRQMSDIEALQQILSPEAFAKLLQLGEGTTEDTETEPTEEPSSENRGLSASSKLTDVLTAKLFYKKKSLPKKVSGGEKWVRSKLRTPEDAEKFMSIATAKGKLDIDDEGRVIGSDAISGDAYFWGGVYAQAKIWSLR